MNIRWAVDFASEEWKLFFKSLWSSGIHRRDGTFLWRIIVKSGFFTGARAFIMGVASDVEGVLKPATFLPFIQSVEAFLAQYTRAGKNSRMLLKKAMEAIVENGMPTPEKFELRIRETTSE
ncbi:hypothetical protein R1flu_009426 [Riccia fluitans]|uniref:LAGLIDADG homing endonuclease n=1 Tax=Riccia fluitans TaxID=41844 RepID=A0ABD1Z4K9_9MARC